MSTPNRDAANEVYTPTHITRPVSSYPETTPSVPGDGVDCSGYNILGFTRTNVGATTSQYKLYYYDNVSWFVAEDSSALATTDYDPTDAVFFQQYNIATVFKYKLVMQSADGTTRVTENLSV